jgi:serine/threonine-protein kinase HipA
MTIPGRLNVWLEAFEAPVGTLERRSDKSLVFIYAPGATKAQRISLSMPVRDEPYGDAAARAYFGNLLHEGRELERIQASYRIDRDDIGALLSHVGADCPGAISVTPEGTGPGKRPGVFPDDYEELDDTSFRLIVRSLHFEGQMPEGSRDPSPVAGVQPKVALVARDGRYYLPKQGSRAPTTHILKVSPAASPDTTRHEAALLTLAREEGLDVAGHEAIVIEIDDVGVEIHAILLTRFDRQIDEDGETHRITRIHGEDLCQALGLERELRYERKAKTPDHRFSIEAVGALANEMTVPGLFRQDFLRQTLFNLMVGNSDNHGKNASILYDKARGRLSPLYDVVPVMIDTKVTHQLAFNLGQAEFIEDLTSEELHAAMMALGFRKPRLDPGMMKLLDRLASRGPGRLEELSGKLLGDAVAAQMAIVVDRLGLRTEVAARDYYPRYERDQQPEVLRGGWGNLS